MRVSERRLPRMIAVLVLAVAGLAVTVSLTKSIAVADSAVPVTTNWSSFGHDRRVGGGNLTRRPPQIRA